MAEALIAIALFAFWIWAVFDVALADAQRVRLMPKLVWLVVVILFQAFGALAWVLFGRPPRGSRHLGRVDDAAPRRPIGLEDQPRFSANQTTTAISDRRSAELDRQLDEWEAEQRRLRGEHTERGDAEPGEPGPGTIA